MPQKKYQTATCAKLFGMAYIPCFFWCWGEKRKKPCPKSNSAWSTCATCVATRRKHVWALKEQRPPAVTETPRWLRTNVTRGNWPRAIEKKKIWCWNSESCNEGHIILCLCCQIWYVNRSLRGLTRVVNHQHWSRINHWRIVWDCLRNRMSV